MVDGIIYNMPILAHKWPVWDDWYVGNAMVHGMVKWWEIEFNVIIKLRTVLFPMLNFSTKQQPFILLIVTHVIYVAHCNPISPISPHSPKCLPHVPPNLGCSLVALGFNSLISLYIYYRYIKMSITTFHN